MYGEEYREFYTIFTDFCESTLSQNKKPACLHTLLFVFKMPTNNNNSIVSASHPATGPHAIREAPVLSLR